MSSTTCMLTCTLLAVTFTAVLSKSLDLPESEPYHQNQLELQGQGSDIPLENALIRYLVTKELLSRVRPPLDLDDRQKKRGYWKQCAFNAVSCFGKK